MALLPPHDEQNLCDGILGEIGSFPARFEEKLDAYTQRSTKMSHAAHVSAVCQRTLSLFRTENAPRTSTAFFWGRLQQDAHFRRTNDRWGWVIGCVGGWKKWAGAKSKGLVTGSATWLKTPDGALAHLSVLSRGNSVKKIALD